MGMAKAKIESTYLDYNRLGMASIYLTISGEGFTKQKFGGTFLDDPLREVSRILSICNVGQWENVPGQEIMAEIEDGRIINISNIRGTAWFGRFRHVHISDIVAYERY